MTVSSPVLIISVVATFVVGYFLGGYNHESDIIRSCTQYKSASRVSWTGKLDFCTKLDNDQKYGIIIK